MRFEFPESIAILAWAPNVLRPRSNQDIPLLADVNIPRLVAAYARAEFWGSTATPRTLPEVSAVGDHVAPPSLLANTPPMPVPSRRRFVSDGLKLTAVTLAPSGPIEVHTAAG